MEGRNEIVRKLRERLEEHYGSDVQRVFHYLPSDFKGLSPALALYVGGTHPERITPQISHKSHLVFLYSVATYGVEGLPEWDEEKAQFVLGALNSKLESFAKTYMKEEGYWTNLEFIEFSEVSPVKLAGRPYFMEIVPLIVHVY